jgi:hypothetical protein
MERAMDYDDYMLMQEEMAEPCVICGEEKGDNCGCEEECIICASAPCRCDEIYDAWKDDKILI